MRSLLFLVLLAGCLPPGTVGFEGETPPVPLTGVVSVQPPDLDFGDVEVGDESVRQVTVTNATAGSVRLRDLQLPDGGLVRVDPLDGPWILESTQSRTFDLTYTPERSEDLLGSFLIRVDDDASFDLEVPVAGRGLAGRLHVTDRELFAYPVDVGCTESDAVLVTNGGQLPMTIEDVRLESDTNSTELGLAGSGGIGLVVEPFETLWIHLNYTPLDGGPDPATLHIETDAPDGVIAIELSPEGRLPGTAYHAFVHDDEWKTDVLWVVAAGPGMGEVRDRLATALDPFLDRMNTLYLDHQTGIVGAQGASGGALHGSPPWVDPWTNDAAGVLRASLSTLPATTTRAFETGLLALGASGPKPNFSRSTSLLHVVFVADRDDSSTLPAGWTVDDVVQAFEAHVPLPGGVVLSTLTGGSAGCSDGLITAEGAPQLASAASATGGVQASVCDASYDATAEALAEVGLGAPALFELEDPLGPGPVSVQVNGQEATGWMYDPAANGIWFPAGHTLQPGDLVEVESSIAPECSYY